MVMSEFGRTPTINRNYGRDHWGAWSIAMAGCGIKGGAVVGKTNANGTAVVDRQVHGGHLFHTYFRALGLNPTRNHYHDGRPIPMADPQGVRHPGSPGLRPGPPGLGGHIRPKRRSRRRKKRSSASRWPPSVDTSIRSMRADWAICRSDCSRCWVRCRRAACTAWLARVDRQVARSRRRSIRAVRRRAESCSRGSDRATPTRSCRLPVRLQDLPGCQLAGIQEIAEEKDDGPPSEDAIEEVEALP